MSAPIGNRFWEARSKHGRDPIFATPKDLWEASVEYFEWVEANPLQEEKLFHANGVIVTGIANKMRAMTLAGLCIFLDISTSAWDEYCKREDYVGVTTRIRDIIYTQKFTGASADLLNPNIIARELGLGESLEIKEQPRQLVIVSPKLEGDKTA
jgi:hypothetical protein